jgi:PAS domain S-box-containing protein
MALNRSLQQQILKTVGPEKLPADFHALLECISDDYDRHEKENESHYKALFENSSDGIYKSSHEGKFIDVNPALVNMLGYNSREELLAIDIKTELYFEAADRNDAYEQDQTEGLSVFRLKKKDGSELWVEDRGQYVYDEQGNILYHEGILRDVTKKVLTELQLKKSERETADYRKALDQSLIVSIADRNGIITYVNENFCRITEYSSDELIGTDHSVFYSGYHTRDFILDLWRTVSKGNVWRGEIKNANKSGGYFWVDTTVVPFLNSQGTPYQFLLLSVDRTERKLAQEDILRKNSELQKTNTELDKFVYSISHDLRAPLCTIQGIINVSMEETSEVEIKQNLMLIDSSAKRLDVLIHDILAYSNNARSEVKREELNFEDIFHVSVESAKCISIRKNDVDISFSMTGNHSFLSDKNRICNILSNLVANGIMYQDSSKDHPFVKVCVKVEELQTIIEVSDNGIGIDPKNQAKVFEMFYRVSENSIGSGLGLYIVKETVDKLNGQIHLRSEKGKGSTFTVHIPNYMRYN